MINNTHTYVHALILYMPVLIPHLWCFGISREQKFPNSSRQLASITRSFVYPSSGCMETFAVIRDNAKLEIEEQSHNKFVTSARNAVESSRLFHCVEWVR